MSEQGLVHLSECQVRWMDMDAYRHVNNTVYLRYLEQARIEMFGPLFGVDGAGGGPDAPAPPPGPDAEPTDGFVIAALDASYRRPLSFRPEPVLVQSWVTRLGRSSIGIEQRIVDPPAGTASGPSSSGASGPYVTATSTLVCIDKAGTRSRPLRAHERAWLARFERSDLDAAGSARRLR